MPQVDTSEFLWEQKYRPQTIRDTILPSAIKAAFQSYVDQKEIPNLLLVGSSGIGKTTSAKALVAEIGADVIVINGSLDRNIDMIRSQVAQFVSTVSFTGGRKFVIIDEADGLSPTTQPALRAFMEEFSHNAGFILTANSLSKIIPALQSRCAIVEFRIPNDEKPALAKEFMLRAEEILKAEGRQYDRKALAMFIQRWFPDWRHILIELHRYSNFGPIDSGILVNVEEAQIEELIGYMRKKEFSNVRKWVGENSDVPQMVLFRRLYDKAADLFQPAFIPAMVVTIGRYGFQSAFAVDPEINASACLAEIMIDGAGHWK